MWQQVHSALHESLTRVLTKIAMLLPAVLALVVAVLIAALVGVALAYAVRRLLALVHFDARVQRSRAAGQMDWVATLGQTQSPSLLLGRVAFWVCVLLGVVVGVAAFTSGYTNSDVMAATLLPYVARIVGAALLLLVGTLLARYLARTVLIGSVNMHLHYARLLGLGVKWLVLVLTAAMVLDHLAIGGRIVELAFGILFGGIVLTLALSVGLGQRGIVSRTLEQDSPTQTNEVATPKVTHF